MKEKRPQKPTKRFSSVKEETAHYNAVLIEDLTDQFKFVVEKVGSMEESFQKRLDQVEKNLRQDASDNRRALEMKIDKILETLNRHDREILSLRQKAVGLDA